MTLSTIGLLLYLCYSGVNCQTKQTYCQGISCNNGTCEDGLDTYTCRCKPGYTGQHCDSSINECEPNPCLNGGSCQDGQDDYECKCLAGISGRSCEVNYDECRSNPCQNGATCVDGINEFKCNCPLGFTSKNCEINIDECTSNPCNGGNCTDLESGVHCTCPPGDYDKMCLPKMNHCTSNPCVNNGHCINQRTGFYCECPQGYTGSDCERVIDECHSNPCQHGGECQDHHNNYTCNCKPGYTGRNCEVDIDECGNNPCKHGDCFNVLNDYICHCHAHYTGINCEIETNPCNPKTCQHSATCVPQNSSQEPFRCMCLRGFTGIRCEHDVNECAPNNPCRNGGTCENRLGSYVCHCVKGYSGNQCEINFNDCQYKQCLNGGTCIDGVERYDCSCVRGFEGLHCEHDIDDCMSNPCFNGSKCNDYVNSYTCTCEPGFSGINCHINDNDCTSSLCLNGGKCLDNVNAYECSCSYGYTGTNCQFSPNLCDSNPCYNGATCFNVHGGYQCHCPFGFTGSQCKSHVNLCMPNPCQNGAECKETNNSRHCNCNGEWAGMFCDVPPISCDEAALQKGVSLLDLCLHNGTCQTIGNAHECSCHRGYDGSYCETDIDECASATCLNGATCQNLVGMHTCLCTEGFTGQHCELNIDDCVSMPCQNGGTCHDLVNGTECSCPSGTSGNFCEVDYDDCQHTTCHNGGTCVDKVGGFRCNCPLGFIGNLCEGDVNECLSNPCDQYRTRNCVQLNNTYQCECNLGWTGKTCSMRQRCDHNPCQNGAECHDTELGPNCTCNQRFIGEFCQNEISDCHPNPCKHQGTCSVTETGYKCLCPIGASGVNCETDSWDDCLSRSCNNGGTCINKIGFFECLCPQLWRGKNCEIYDKHFEGGIGIAFENSVPEICLKYNCPQKANNGICDNECNLIECNYDNTQCSYGTKPWKNCTHQVNGRYCWQVFKDNKCDQECNNQNCLYDGFDCQRPMRDCPFEKYCVKFYNNGYCDHGCNTVECNWDGSDCDTNLAKLVPGSLFIIVIIEPNKFQDIKKEFVRQLGFLLLAVVRIKKRDSGEEMIYSWQQKALISENSELHRARRWGEPLFEMSDSRYKRSALTGTKVYLEIDIQACYKLENQKCFSNIDEAAQFLVATLIKKDYQPTVSIHQVGFEKSRGPPPDSENSNVFIIFGAVCVTILALIFVIIVVLNRKRVRGITWFPDGFFSQSREHLKPAQNHKGPDGEEMQEKFYKMDAKDSQTSPPPSNEFWKEQDDEDRPLRKRTKIDRQGYIMDKTDTRHWTVKHLDAANVPHHLLSVLTPPYGEDGLQAANDVNVQGPDGFTPLMLASIRGCGIGDDDDSNSRSGSPECDNMDNNTAMDMMTSLLVQGAAINAQTGGTGETSLHLAARYARAHAAKVLLDAGADPNAEDSTGRTPLHTAIAAGAHGVFQILLRNRSTNLDAHMHCGTTSLILACRLAIEDTVEELLDAEADIEAADNSGRTALHWAASVNNVDAVMILLRNNANRDAQNAKEETPLFLASREGSLESVKILLEHYANRKIKDNMDRLPRDVAMERRHGDIVELLDTYIVTSPSSTHLDGMSPSHQSGVGTGGYMQVAKQKTKIRRTKSKSSVVKNLDSIQAHDSVIDGPVANRQAKTRKRKVDKSGSRSKVNQEKKEQYLRIPVSSSLSQSQLIQPSSSDSSPMNTISPGNYSTDSHQSVPHYGTSPLRFENPCHVLPSDLAEESQHVDDFQMMVEHYNSSPLMEHKDLETLLTELVNLQYIHQQQQLQIQHISGGGPAPTAGLPIVVLPNAQNGGMEVSTGALNGSADHVLSPSMKVKNLSQTHIQEIQQHTHQQAAHKRPQHISDFSTTFPRDETTQLSDLTQTQEQVYSSSTPNKMLQLQQWQQHHHYQQPEQIMQQPHQVGYTLTKEQYPTSHSHNSQHLTDSPLHQQNTYYSFRPDQLLTPSPGSPSHWSSSSPHSVHSDWSEGISSPAPAISRLNQHRNKLASGHAYF